MKYLITENQNLRFKKVIYKFLNLMYSDCKLVKIGTFDALIGENKDDLKFTVSLRGTMELYDTIDFLIYKMFGVNASILEKILIEWVKETYDIEVKNVIFT
jgi:hypothetical protein